VGSSHHGPLGRVLLGWVGERRAIGIAPCGYAAREQRPIGTIAIAFDGSQESQVALRAARGLAIRTGATLRALTVIEPPAAIPGQFVPLAGLEPLVTIERAEAIQRQESAARAALDSALEELGDGTVIRQEVLSGADPAAAILD
jgi:nucleotide-binding universal stress UspA family protein